MKNSKENPNHMSIPSTWTVEQADAVFMFLRTIADAVFEAYEKPFCDLCRDQILVEEYEERTAENEKYEDCDIPF